jgi:hypothetical protein
MARYYADVDLYVRIFFDDDGENEIVDQADNVAEELTSINWKEGELEDYGRTVRNVKPVPVTVKV